jgi:hypothetical protein
MNPDHSRPAARFTRGTVPAARSTDTMPAARAVRSGGVMVWLPWICAPAFALLPIAGCGLAGTLRSPAPPAAVASVAHDARPPLLPGPRDARLVRIGAVMPTALPHR